MSSIWFLFACTTAPTDAPPAPPTPTIAPASPADHGSMADHMTVMSTTRERLRTELGADYDAPVPGFDTAAGARGKVVYDASCAACHGALGKGDGAAGAGLNPRPADFTDAFHARYYSDAGRVRIIEKGSPDTAMVAFEGQLDRQQILDVYAYVRVFRGDAAPPAAAEHDHSSHAH